MRSTEKLTLDTGEEDRILQDLVSRLHGAKNDVTRERAFSVGGRELWQLLQRTEPEQRMPLFTKLRHSMDRVKLQSDLFVRMLYETMMVHHLDTPATEGDDEELEVS